MPRSYQRSFRLDDDLRAFIDSLPFGTANSLVNELLKEFQRNGQLRRKIALQDARFKDWTPMRLVEMPLPFSDLPKPKRARTVDSSSNP